MTFIQPGTPRIKLLTVTGTPVLWLPQPNPGQPSLQWIPKGIVKELYDGREVWRQLGWIPELTIEWSIYDDRSTEGWTIGTANGNRPAVSDLLAILSGAPGSFSISPGPSAGGFVPQSWKESAIGVVPGGYAKGLQLTLRGGAIYSSKVLGAF